MNEQKPLALRLADKFDHPLPPEWEEMKQTAAELRRLAAVEKTAAAVAEHFQQQIDRLRSELEAARGKVDAPDKDLLVDLICEHMTSVYHCNRAWEAWHVGTMSKDDFSPYADSDSPDELADSILALLAAPHP